MADPDVSDMNVDGEEGGETRPTEVVLEGGDDDEVYEFKVKWNKSAFRVVATSSHSVLDLKTAITTMTGVLTHRQKIVGIKVPKEAESDADALLGAIKIKTPVQKVMMIGAVEEDIFVDPDDKDDLPEVLDDFDYDYFPSQAEVEWDTEAMRLLEEAIESTEITFLNEPREGKKLLVLDLDYTLFDMKGTAERWDELKRPFTDILLEATYEEYDLVVWSQTSWRWLELKLTELGMLTNPAYRFLFVLDKTSMFRITGRVRGKIRKHHVKPLELIWRNLPQYNATNTIHIDDLGRNFALNPSSGLKIKAYKKSYKNRATDVELRELAKYLVLIARESDFEALDHAKWKQYVAENWHQDDA